MYRSIVDAVKAHAQSKPESPCVVDDKGMHLYGEIWNKAKKTAGYYQSIGVENGDYVIVECTQDANYLIHAMACQLYGAVFVPLEKGAAEERCLDIVNSVGARVLICTSDYSVDVEKYDSLEFMKLVESANVEFSDREIGGSDVAEILYTTGTTGTPKGIMITNSNNVAVAENIVSGTEMKEDNVELIPLMLSHSHGLRTCYANLLNGSAVVLIDGVTRVNEVVSLIETYHVTSLDLSPSAGKVLLKLSKGYMSNYKDQIDYVEIGTAALGEDLKEDLCNTFPKSRLYNFYGSTESGRTCVLDFNHSRGKNGCIGHPSVNAKFVVVTEEREIISSSKDNMGLLAIKGPMNMKGYWKDQEATDGVMADGYVYTKDLGYIDEEGYVYMLGRADDVINCKGIKIAPEEIEGCAMKYEGILDCACVPMEDKISGQAPKLFVVVADQAQFDQKDFYSFLSMTLDTNRRPKMIELIDSIPRTANGKIQRKKLI